MCNLYTIRKTGQELAALFDATTVAAVDGPGDIYPKGLAPVVRAADGSRILEPMRWGFPPPPQGRAPVTNIRNLASPFWRNALHKPAQRCLVPVERFCEWEGDAGRKIKRWFSLPSRPVFAFAGLWRPTATGPAFAFLTCDPNPLVAPIHPKAMPVILDEADHDRWLSGAVDDACALALPYPSQLMRVG